MRVSRFWAPCALLLMIREANCGCIINPDGLGHVNFPSSNSSIPVGAFHGCEALRTISIPSSVRTIGFDAFYNTPNLQSVVIPPSVRHIDSYAFHRAGLRSAIIPSGINLSPTAFQRATCNLEINIERGNGIFVAGARICDCGTCAPTTAQPTPPPTPAPTSAPSSSYPTRFPTKQPTASPTLSPSLSSPTSAPTLSPTISPTFSSPSSAPTHAPTVSPTITPTLSPTIKPTYGPTRTVIPLAATGQDESGSSTVIIVGIILSLLVVCVVVAYFGARRWRSGGKVPSQIPTFEGEFAISGEPKTPEIVNPAFTNNAFSSIAESDYVMPTKVPSFKGSSSALFKMPLEEHCAVSNTVYAIPMSDNNDYYEEPKTVEVDSFGNFYEEPKTPSSPDSVSFGFGADYAALDASQTVYGSKQSGPADYSVPDPQERTVYASAPRRPSQDTHTKPLYHIASDSSMTVYATPIVKHDFNAVHPLSSEDEA